MSGEPNAPMTPQDYVEALDARDDRRRAYLACLVVCHVADSVGLAVAAAIPRFEALRGRPRKAAVDAATEGVKGEASKRCGAVFDVVQGIANGTKHPGRLPLLPGTEKSVPAFAFDTPGADFDLGRWDVPGLALHAAGEVLFLDACAQQVLAAFICAYPTHLGEIALSSFMDLGLPVLGLDLPLVVLMAIGTWAAAQPEVADVWLFGSRAKGVARPDSDVDLGVVLVSGEPGHDWPLANVLSAGTRWRDALKEIVGQHVSLEIFSRPGESQDEDERAARTSAILLWRREV